MAPLLEELDLGENPILIPSLVQVFPQISALRKLGLNRTNLGDREVLVLASHLRLIPHLKSLHLANNSIENNGMETLAVALSTLDNFLHLDVSNNHITDFNLGVLSDLNLDVFVLDDNPISTTCKRILHDMFGPIIEDDVYEDVPLPPLQN